MRISDWSSDVCASVLGGPDVFGQRSDACIALFSQCAADPARGAWLRCRDWGAVGSAVRIAQPPHSEDRKSVVSGKSVSVRVALGGRGSLITKNHTYTHLHITKVHIVPTKLTIQ